VNGYLVESLEAQEIKAETVAADGNRDVMTFDSD